MVVIESIDGTKKNIKCIACALQQGKIKRFGEIVAETKYFVVDQDYEIPIPGFMILASKKHIKGIEDFSKEQRIEFIELLYKIRKAIKEVLGIDYVYIIQEEDSIKKSSHFHVWLFPKYDWMKRIGEGVQFTRQIMEYARKNMKTKDNLDNVKKAALKIKQYFKKL